MSFGLTNAPATFQRMMAIKLGNEIGKSCLVYLDDIFFILAIASKKAIAVENKENPRIRGAENDQANAGIPKFNELF